ncbi:MAG: hypothetical protein U9R32_00865 [Bacteroidota bacterium]|nr:hypothetical protein [Bacteroidota bacterium]
MKSVKNSLLLIFVLFALVAGAQNPLFSKSKNKQPVVDTISVTNIKTVAIENEDANSFALPSVFQKMFAKITVIQSKLNIKFSELGNKINNEGSFLTVLLILLVSFIYGIIHAIGPGHGKFVVFSYFLADEAKIKKGILLGNLIGFLHAISAIVIVFSVYFILKLSLSQSIEDVSHVIKIISYGILTLFGLYMIYHNISHFRDKAVDEKGDIKVAADTKILPLAIAVGMIPCPGTTIILIFSISAGIIVTGLFAALAMALGMGITISVIGVLTIISKKGVVKITKGNNKISTLILKTTSLLGAVLIVLLGAVMFIGSL